MLHRRNGEWFRAIGAGVLVAALAGPGSMVGCAVGSPVGSECKTGADCESGACDQGVCVPMGGGGDAGGGSAGGSPATGGNGALGGGPVDEGGGGGQTGLCSPGHDGVVTRQEVPLQAGLEAHFKVATNATFSTAGTTVDGATTWDMTQALSGDHTDLIETLPLAGTWYENDFAGATYASQLSDSSDLLGVFEIDDDALLLRGVVSPESGVAQTELTYDPPVVVLAFPLQEGATWSTDSTVTGTNQGVFGVYYESYESTVDVRGNAITPFSQFDVLRVRVDLTRNVGGFITTQKTFAFVAECFGTIATMASQVDETQDEFTDLSEIKRLTP